MSEQTRAARLLEKATAATNELRDAARQGRVIEFRQRDPLVLDIHAAFDELERLLAELTAAEAQRDEARTIVADVNNSVIGSHGYFTEPSCVKAIEDLKQHANQTVRRAEAAEAELKVALESLSRIALTGKLEEK